MGWANQVSKYGWREHLALSNSQNVIILCKSNSYFHMCPLSSVQSPLAQLVERETVNLEASGSTPLRRAFDLTSFSPFIRHPPLFLLLSFPSRQLLLKFIHAVENHIYTT
jgi:hypothetical protein